MKINIYMKNRHPHYIGAVVAITEKDEPLHDGLKRYFWIECEKYDQLLNVVNEHYSGWGRGEIALDIELDESPLVIRDEIFYALKDPRLAKLPFTAQYAETLADGSPFTSEIRRRTLIASSVCPSD